MDGDGAKEIVTGGSYFDGTHWIAQLHVWNGATLAVKNVVTWLWGTDTQISSVAIGNVDGDSAVEIVTGGAFFDGTHWIAQLHVWNGATLAVKNVVTWLWGTNTYVNSVATATVSGTPSIITGSVFNDGTHQVAQLHVWNGATLAVSNVVTWLWGTNTYLNAVAFSNIGGTDSIVTGGSYNTGSVMRAQVHIWNAATLGVIAEKDWNTISDTTINSISSRIIR